MSRTKVGHGLGPTRARVLDMLLGEADPVDCVTVAKSVGLHPNGARFHLDALIDAGFAERSVEHRTAKGRPKVLYFASEAAPQVSNEHWQALTRAIVSHVINTQPEPLEHALEAGRRWGTEVAGPAGDSTAVQGLADYLRSAGFATLVDSDDQQLRFTHCAFAAWDAEQRHPVCALHLGLMQGYLSANEGGWKVTQLDRSRQLCTAHLGRGPHALPAQGLTD